MYIYIYIYVYVYIYIYVYINIRRVYVYAFPGCFFVSVVLFVFVSFLMKIPQNAKVIRVARGSSGDKALACSAP